VGRVTDTPADEDVRAVLHGEQRLLAPDAPRSELEALLHPDFTEVDPTGRRWERADLIAALTAAADRDPAPRIAVDVQAVRLSSSTVLVTYVSEQGVRRARRVSLWLRTGPGWRAYYHQSTPVLPS
jgi:hypothetical protein